VPIYLTGVVTVIAYNTDVVRAQIQGQIVSINFTEGQQRAYRATCSRRSTRVPTRLRSTSSLANLDRDRAQLQNAEANLARYTPLLSRGFAHAAAGRTPRRRKSRNCRRLSQGDQALIEASECAASATRG